MSRESKPKPDQNDRLDSVEKTIADIRSNDLPHLAEEINDVKECLAEAKTDIAVVKTNVAWLVKFVFIVITASVGGLITGLVNLFVSIKI